MFSDMLQVRVLSPPTFNGVNMKKTYILDTNILLSNHLAVVSFEEHDVVIPLVVLEELDNIKMRKNDL